MYSEIKDYFDFEKLNSLLEGFNLATGFVTAILDLEGNVLSKSGWREVCTDFHRLNQDTASNCKKSDTVLASKMADGKDFHAYKCINGLVDVVVPIIIKDEHIANLFSGQFFFEEPSLDFFKKQAQKYSFNEQAYLLAIKKVPVVSEEKVEITMKILVDIIEMISELTVEKFEQQELNNLLETSYEEITAQYTELEEVKKALEVSRSRYELAFEGANSGIFDQNFEEAVNYINSDWYNQYLNNTLTDFDDFYSLVDLIPLEHKESYKRLKSELFESQERKYGMEFPVKVEGSNDTHWILENGVIIRDAQENVKRVIGSHREITHLKNNIQKIDDLKVYDQLTKLYNKNALELHLEKILGSEENYPIAMILIDLDNFKYINDQYGHHRGDEILKTLANRMMQNEVADYISRFGGDEFVLILNALESIEVLIERLYEINYFIESEISIGSDIYYISASFGVVLSPEHGVEHHDLLRKADLAMYEVKSSNENTWYRIYDEGISEIFEKRVKSIHEMKLGLENEEFYMVYQPVVDVITSKIYSVEALMRWQHKGKHISPDKFIPLAEESGYIYELGLISIRESIKFLKDAKEKVNVSINLSAIQLKNPQLMDIFEKVIRENNVSYENIIIEITETAVIEDFDQTIKILDKMKALGFRIALDDFGTGYSSLSYLTKLPVDILKIDKSFVQSINAKDETVDLIEAIVTIAQKRALEIVFEGVETKEQLRFMIRLNCRLAQGYYFFKPLDKNHLYQLIGTND